MNKTPILLLAAVFILGCGGNSDSGTEEAASYPETATSSEPSTEAVIEVDISAENIDTVRAVLEAADLVDGNQDQVIENCPGCSLAMQGQAEYAMKAADHELHFCSAECRHRFAGDAETAIAQLEVPAP